MPAKRDDRTDRPEGDIVTLAHIVLRLRRSGAIVPALTAGHNRTLRRCATNPDLSCNPVRFRV